MRATFTEGCDRCANDRRARALRKVMSVMSAICIALCAVPCGSCVAIHGAGGLMAWERVIRLERLTFALIPLALMGALVVGLLSTLADRFIRRASTLPPRPPMDPRSGYRDGCTARECPVHPFAPPRS